MGDVGRTVRHLERRDPDGTDWMIVMEHVEVLRTRHRMLAAQAAASGQRPGRRQLVI